ncbi:pentatricopeptide repeat-containing protein At5g42450, mitochondrial-like [Nicotiana tabacum]|uniref:Pentatricopeptide repeat-containing protein At5g42450, mitochondrial-like n=2 Tax=Nicotiana TaxID=4085 RepID=A0A1S4B782_TOBAC|nr:PREDICTED: pentatricopeptide repeat-containing protein At5g42450, mitochondrial-like [Nicotiana sylvestris]XP_016484653.1 PREDICTED: pentatricopeptide repeat-containing protein At5g42450, mitochondrial-like [Nicotiana tabacum]
MNHLYLLRSIRLTFQYLPVYIRFQSSPCRRLRQTTELRPHLHNPAVPTIEPASVTCQSDANADQLFDELPKCDAVSATALVVRFAKLNQHKKAITFFSRMFEFYIRPNEFTLGTVIHSSVVLKDLNSGKQIHAISIKFGLHSNVYVGSALLDLYVKLSSIEEAQLVFQDTHKPNVVSYTTLICGYLKKEKFNEAIEIFRTIPERNVVSWNAMISGYSQRGRNEEAVNLFVEMLRQRVVPDQSTFPSLFSAAANIAALGRGKSFHACAVKFLGGLGLFIGNSLVSFYAKCGSLEDSFRVFNRLPERNVVTWNALICAHAQNGRGKVAIELFQKMKDMGIKPNSVTLLGLLLACSHVGLVDEAYSYFEQARIQDASLLKSEHYACMVDILSRSGRFQQAEKFIHELPFDPGIGFWKALLGGCQIHSNTKLGEYAAQKVLALEPRDVSSYVMLSNAHSAAGRWQSVSVVRNEMKVKGLKTVPGCSWVEIKCKIHVFVTGDNRYTRKPEIYELLDYFLMHAMKSQETDFFHES